MITKLDPGKVTRLLTQGTRQMDDATLSALVSARQKALGRQSVRAPVFALSTGQWMEHSWTHHLIPHSTKQWFAVGLLAATLIAGAGYWQQMQEQQLSEIDVAILTDELPIEVFVD